MLRIALALTIALSTSATAQINRSLDLNFHAPIQDYVGPTRARLEAQIQRAGAWGQCVVSREPELSLSYARSSNIRRQQKLPDGLRSAFMECHEHVGSFLYDDRPRILKAAISDAWRSTGKI